MNSESSRLPASTTDLQPFRLGEWVVRPPRNIIEGRGQSIQVEPRIMHVLVCLACHPEEVISRRALLETVWGGAVVQEEVLTYAVSQLRRLLGDDARSPQLIETIRKSGYRLKVPIQSPVTVISPNKSTILTSAEGLDPGGTTRRPSRDPSVQKFLWLFVGVGSVAVLVIAWYLGVYRSDQSIQARHTGILDEVPVTSLPGYEIHPAISPDGTRVVFSWYSSGDSVFKLHAHRVDPNHKTKVIFGYEQVAGPTHRPVDRWPC